jgi:hypothetical protein
VLQCKACVRTSVPPSSLLRTAPRVLDKQLHPPTLVRESATLLFLGNIGSQKVPKCPCPPSSLSRSFVRSTVSMWPHPLGTSEPVNQSSACPLVKSFFAQSVILAGVGLLARSLRRQARCRSSRTQGSGSNSRKHSSATGCALPVGYSSTHP